MNDLLRIRSLSKHYDGFDLRNVDLTVPAGSVVGFIGSNGAGKTTTIKASLGLIYPDAGSIELLGQNVGEHAGSKAIKDAKQRTGVVFDTCSFPEEMTVASVGKLMSYSYDSWSPADFEQRLAQFQLPKSKTVKDLSRGMSMKLSLACALAHDPDLLILDEATAGLDPLAREEALDILRGYMRDERHGILMSSHITSDLEKVADYVTYLHRGRVAVSGAKDELLDTYGKLVCGRSELERVDPALLVGVRSGQFGCEALVKNRRAFARFHPELAVEPVSLEDIMVFTVKGDAR